MNDPRVFSEELVSASSMTLEALWQRILDMELMLNDINEHSANAEKHEDNVEVMTAEDKEEASLAPLRIRSRRFTWTNRDCRAMRNHKTTLTIYETGRWKCVSDVEDRSDFSKWTYTIWLSFAFKTGEYIGSVGKDCRYEVWSGNFSPHERKTYTRSGFCQWVKDDYDLLISSEVNVWMSWHCRRRN